MTEILDRPFWEESISGFGPWTEADDLLHPHADGKDAGDALTETHYFGFNSPEHKIHGMGYLWHRPNLGVASCGAWAWRGVKRHNLQCELYDWTGFNSDAALSNDLHEYDFANSYHVQTVKPMTEHRIRYANVAAANAFDLRYQAMMPPMMVATGSHFEQAMHVTGEITLRGETFKVDSYTVRDRSWAQMRPERHVPGPPLTWISGVFGPDLMFGCTASDSPSLDPEWKNWWPTTDEAAFRSGWVRRDGRTLAIRSMRKITRRNPETLFPEGAELTLIDEEGRQYNLTGTVIAAANLRAWQNIDSIICLIRWSCDGRTGHGDFQDIWGSDYIRAFLPR